MRCLEEDLEALLQFFHCPPRLWKKLRTTNAIDRLFVEVRRRIRIDLYRRKATRSEALEIFVKEQSKRRGPEVTLSSWLPWPSLLEEL